VLIVAGVKVIVNVQDALTATCCAQPFPLVGIVNTGDELKKLLTDNGSVPQF